MELGPQSRVNLAVVSDMDLVFHSNMKRLLRPVCLLSLSNERLEIDRKYTTVFLFFSLHMPGSLVLCLFSTVKCRCWQY